MIVVWSGVSFQLFFAVRVDAGGSLRSTFHNETEYARCSVESPPSPVPAATVRGGCLSVYREVCRVLCAVSTRRVVLRTRLPSRAPRILRRSAWVDERL